MGKAGAVPSYKLNSGASIPAVGLGISAIEESPAETKAYVLKALEVGYRHLDTAKVYNTEAAVGEALKEAFSSGIVTRGEVFVTTKLFANDMDPPEIISVLQESLRKMQLDYVDLYLIHWPLHFRKEANLYQLTEEDFLPLDLKGCWNAFEQAVQLGLTKSIGVSNFSAERLKEIEPDSKLLPAVNQMEMHPGCEQTHVREYCKRKGILVTAWSPLGAPGYGAVSGVVWGSNIVLDSPILREIATKHGKTVAQVALRWGLDNGVGLIVKSSNPERMTQNLDLFDWTLSHEDLALIKTMPANRIFDGSVFINVTTSPYKSLKDLWGEDA